jgi:hypothetical protein
MEDSSLLVLYLNYGTNELIGVVVIGGLAGFSQSAK